MIEPARRAVRRRDAREARGAVRRRPSAGRPPRAASSGTRPTCSCRPSPAPRPSASPCPASFDMEVASSKYLYGLPDGEVPLAFNFNGTVHYRGDDGRLQMSLVPWSCSAEFRLPVPTWRELIEHYYPQTGWIAAARRHARGAPAREGHARAADARRLRGGAARGARDERRGAGRLAALRGLRALPLHAGRDQERHARRRSGSSTRPRTRGRSTRPTTTSSCECVVEGDGEVTRRGALPRAERRAPPGRAAADRGRAATSSSAGSSVARRQLGGQTAARGGRAAGLLPRREPRPTRRRASTARARSRAR